VSNSSNKANFHDSTETSMVDAGGLSLSLFPNIIIHCDMSNDSEKGIFYNSSTSILKIGGLSSSLFRNIIIHCDMSNDWEKGIFYDSSTSMLK
jgi:hypothetical protein